MKEFNDPAMVALAENLKHIRELNGGTFIEMEKATGYYRQCWSSVEYKAQDIKYLTTVHLAESLNVSFPFLFSREFKQWDQEELGKHPYQQENYLMVYVSNIKRLMRRRQMKQAMLAELSDMPPETVSRIFSGVYQNPMISKLAAMATAIDSDLFDLFLRK